MNDFELELHIVIRDLDLDDLETIQDYIAAEVGSFVDSLGGEFEIGGGVSEVPDGKKADA